MLEDENINSETIGDQGKQESGIGRDEPDPGGTHQKGEGGWGGQFGDIKRDDKVESPPEPSDPGRN